MTKDYSGRVINNFKVLRKSGKKDKDHRTIYLCQCNCGDTFELNVAKLTGRPQYGCPPCSRQMHSQRIKASLTPEYRIALDDLIRRHPKASQRELQRLLYEATGSLVSIVTVSKACREQGLGRRTPRRKNGTGSISAAGYVLVTQEGRQVPEHRVVMERMLGRSLFPNEEVHHKNGCRSDNSPDNLELWVKRQPCGQRTEDKLKYAQEILCRYPSTSDLPRLPLVEIEVKLPVGSSVPGLMWDYLSIHGTATTVELAGVLGVLNGSLLQLLKSHMGSFERAPKLPQDPYNSFRWKIREGASRPESYAKGSYTPSGYHRYTINGKSVRAHRYIMEQHLGRKLLKHENVHHKNGDRSDNRLANLEVWSTLQPKGQRVPDLVEWAQEIVTLYAA